MSQSQLSLPLANKPQILRLHQLQQTQRSKFITSFNATLYQFLPSTMLRLLKSSSSLAVMAGLLPDFYYTFVTVNHCRRRLGEEYTYVAMFSKEHYQNQGVLLNKKTRTLMTVLQLIGRYAVRPFIIKNIKKKIEQTENSQERSSMTSMISNLVKFVGTGQTILQNVDWIVLMLFMLNVSKRYSIIQNLLGISYVYTYKNQKVKQISYKLEGYIIFVTLVVKLVRHLYKLYLQTQENKKGKVRDKVMRVEEKSTEEVGKGKKGEKLLCRICYDQMKDRTATKCGHIFCWSCIVQTLQITQECPVCRTPCLPRQAVQLRNY